MMNILASSSMSSSNFTSSHQLHWIFSRKVSAANTHLNIKANAVLNIFCSKLIGVFWSRDCSLITHFIYSTQYDRIFWLVTNFSYVGEIWDGFLKGLFTIPETLVRRFEQKQQNKLSEFTAMYTHVLREILFLYSSFSKLN